MTLRNKETFSLVTAFILSGVLWFGLLGYRDLVDPDEGRYAQIPAAMESSGDWLTPRLNDFKYFEKPVLQYWATAVIYKLLGKNNATARLWTALTGFALALGALQLLVLGFDSLAETRSGRVVADIIAESVPAGTPVFSFRTLSESAAFYLDSSFTLVEYTGELKMGIEQEPDKYISSFKEFLGKWQQLEQAALIVNISTSKEHDLSVLAGKVVYKGPKRMVIIKS